MINFIAAILLLILNSYQRKKINSNFPCVITVEFSQKLENQYFDMTILDIMGVDGYYLLKIANRKKVIAVMKVSILLYIGS